MGWFRRKPTDEDDATSSFEERLAQIGPGVPGHCPACGGLGYIDNIDIGYHYQIQHCKDCLHRWEYLFDGDGKVVGLTELDADGKPVTRSRVRPDRTTTPVDDQAAPVPVPAPPIDLTEPMDDPVDAAPDGVVDIRAPGEADGPVVDLTASELSPVEWLRRSGRR